MLSVRNSTTFTSVTGTPPVPASPHRSYFWRGVVLPESVPPSPYQRHQPFVRGSPRSPPVPFSNNFKNSSLIFDNSSCMDLSSPLTDPSSSSTPFSLSSVEILESSTFWITLTSVCFLVWVSSNARRLCSQSAQMNFSSTQKAHLNKAI